MSDTSAAAPKIGKATLIQVALNTLAMVAFAALALTSFRWVGFGLAAITMIVLGGLYLRRKVGGYATVQVLVLLASLVYYVRRPGITEMDDRLLVATGIVLMGMLLNQRLFKRIVVRKKILVANLPGAEFPTKPLVNPRFLFGADYLLVVLVGISAAINAPGWPVATLTFLVALAHVALVAQAALRRRKEGNANAMVNAALERYAPDFAVYFSAPVASRFHIEMWLPSMDLLKHRYVVILREAHSIDMVAGLTDQPVVVCPSTASLDNVAVSSLKTTYYVNNAAKNTHFVRFGHIRHIFLNHGDSDKASSFNPIVVMYDKLYVAGQAGIDRYLENGVNLGPERFVVTGRPQVAPIAVADRPINTIAEKTVLYAPTWAGYYSDTSHTSLPIGTKIVGELLSRGLRVIYRPHPYTDRYPHTRAMGAEINAMLAADAEKTGRQHLYGDLAKSEMPLFACFNECDAAIADVSGVSSDFLYSEKPLAVTDAQGEGDEFITNNPLCRATYVITQDGANIPQVVDALIGNDPLAETRSRMKRYILGDFPPASYQDGFVDAALYDIGATTDFVQRGVVPFVDPATEGTPAGVRIPTQVSGDGVLSHQ